MLPMELVERRFLVNRAAIRRYAQITDDYNPIHLDPEFAARSAMGGVIAHGMLSLSLIWQSLTATFGLERTTDIELTVRFLRPVREDDWVVAGGRQTTEAKRYEVWVRAERAESSETVIGGSVTLRDAAT